MHKANGAPTPHPRCILSWNSRNLSKQLLFDNSLSLPRAFFPSGSGPRSSGWQHTARDKHWVQLLFDSGSSLLGAVFFPSGSGPGAAVGVMQIEINTGYSCYLICKNSRHRMALQSSTVLNTVKCMPD